MTLRHARRQIYQPILLGFVTVFVVFAGRVPIHGQGATTRLRFAVNMTTIESAPVFLAAEGSSGAEISISAGGIPQLVSGDADAATNAETQALFRSVASPNLRIVLTVAECYYRIVARRSAGISRVSDLKGKRVGTSLNTSAHYFLTKMVRTAGIADKDVTALALPLPEMPAALKRGDVDAIAIWEPQAHNSEQALGADAIVFQDRSVYRELFDLNTTAEVLADAIKRRALVAAVARIITASEQVTGRPPSVWPLVSAKISVPEPTISAVWKHFRFAGGLPRDLLDVMVEEERWVAAVQKREPRVREALRRLVDDTVLRDAVASLRR
jgi:NitT/TauT family transport system substrate-binding protein